MFENKLIGKSLANEKTNVYMPISYACVVLLFYSQHVRKIRNGIRKDS